VNRIQLIILAVEGACVSVAAIITIWIISTQVRFIACFIAVGRRAWCQCRHVVLGTGHMLVEVEVDTCFSFGA
jgi:hypothetical protein